MAKGRESGQKAAPVWVNLGYTARMAHGHVFLIRGDLRTLRCDAIGYSGNYHNAPSSVWRTDMGADRVGVPSPIDERREIRRYSVQEGEPAAYTVNVAGSHTKPISWYLDAISVFLKRAYDDAKKENRKIPRIVIPLLGGGRGGKRWAQGELLGSTLKLLWDFTRRRGVDVALVCDRQEVFDAAQWYRRREGEQAWKALPEELQQKADLLAQKASRGDVALFLGAGVSMGAGLPSWTGLLDSIAKEVLTPDEIEEAKRISSLDYAQLLAKLMGEEQLRAKVTHAIVSKKRVSFSHALLAALPVNEVVTTNYDSLFEIAAEKAGRPVHVLPYRGTLSRDVRWLLKLHGSIEKPEDIVLSRQTFLQYESSRAALAGLLAGVLLTRHALFVGSSFSDDNVLRITEEVQRLGASNVGGEESARLGTCLALGLPKVQQKLWKGDFDWIDFGPNPVVGGRILDVFLDRLLASTTTTASYLFDKHFDGALSAEEKQLRDQLTSLLYSYETVNHPAVRTLLDQLRGRLGLPETEPTETVETVSTPESIKPKDPV